MTSARTDQATGDMIHEGKARATANIVTEAGLSITPRVAETTCNMLPDGSSDDPKRVAERSL